MNLEIIKEQEVLGKQFTLYKNENEDFLVLAKDVAEWLDYSVSNVSKLINSVEVDEKALVKIIREDGSTHKQWFITEEGLYEVLMLSKKPIAKQFKTEVKKILKSIRQVGMYVTKDLLNNPEFLIATLEKLMEEQAKVTELNKTITIQNQQMLEMKPKVSYYDKVLNCKDLVSISMISKDYGMSARRFNALLNKHKIQFKQGNMWFLYQQYAENGYTNTKTFEYESSNEDEIHINTHTYWTQKGRLFLYDFLKQQDIVPLIEKEEIN